MGTALGSCPLWDCKLSNHGLGPGISLWQHGLGSWAAGSWLACRDLSSSVTAAGLTRQPLYTATDLPAEPDVPTHSQGQGAPGAPLGT